MANRIVCNMYLIDSQTGAASALQPGSASWPTLKARVQVAALWAADTTGLWEMVYASDTSTSAWKLTPETAPAPTGGTFTSLVLDGVEFEELRCKTLTAGTGYIYFV